MLARWSRGARCVAARCCHTRGASRHGVGGAVWARGAATGTDGSDGGVVTTVAGGVGKGQELQLETGKVAKLADGAVLAKQGGTVVLATVVASRDDASANTFLPLTVEYKERAFAFGQIPSQHTRRERSAPSDHEVLGSRVIDRTLRPLFPAHYFAETQIVTDVLSYDAEADPETLSITAASAALMASPVLWNGPAAAVRVGWQDGEPVLSPSRREAATGELDLLYAGTDSHAVMVEVAACELGEDQLKAAFQFAHDQLQPRLEVLRDFASAVGPVDPIDFASPYPDATLVAATTEAFLSDAKQFWQSPFASKQDRKKAQSQLMGRIVRTIGQAFPDASADTINLAGDVLLERAMRDVVIEAHAKRDTTVAVNGFRLDGRGADTVRSLQCEVDTLPAAHGSALFSRGDTQALCSVTLGPPHMTVPPQSIDMEPKSFFLHYEFPPYCVNEVGKLGVNRRMIGHGALAEKAIAAVMPSAEAFDYAVRGTSHVTGSDGSSSMATVCGTSLALLDAGVPVPHVAGISVGLVTALNDSGEPIVGGDEVLLTDILGMEDHFGDMDFKVAGTRSGVTAVQLDIKLNGVSLEVLCGALDKARAARSHVLDAMEAAMPAAREELKDTAPRLRLIYIPDDKRPTVLANGAAALKAIEASTGAKIAMDDRRNMLNVWAPSPAAFEAVETEVEELLNPKVPLAVGTVYMAQVVKLLAYGLIMKVVAPHASDAAAAHGHSCVGFKGLLHVSHWSHERDATLDNLVNPGDVVAVKVLDIDSTGEVLFSRREVADADRMLLRVGEHDFPLLLDDDDSAEHSGV